MAPEYNSDGIARHNGNANRVVSAQIKLEFTQAHRGDVGSNGVPQRIRAAPYALGTANPECLQADPGELCHIAEYGLEHGRHTAHVVWIAVAQRKRRIAQGRVA